MDRSLLIVVGVAAGSFIANFVTRETPIVISTFRVTPMHRYLACVLGACWRERESARALVRLRTRRW